MLVPLFEFVVSPCARVDRDAGVIRDVKVLGYASANGRRYTPESVRRAVALYEGVRVNVDHPPSTRPEAERPLAARFGVLKNVAVREEGLFADLHYLRSHPLAEMTAEAAERMPEALGLSHNAEGRVAQQAGQTVVEEIVRVRSVDLVADPATTRSLFEEAPPNRQDDTTRQRQEARRRLESLGVPFDTELVEAVACVSDELQRQALIEALGRLAATASRRPSFAPRSSEPFWDAARPRAFPADAAGFAKSLRGAARA